MKRTFFFCLTIATHAAVADTWIWDGPGAARFEIPKDHVLRIQNFWERRQSGRFEKGGISTGVQFFNPEFDSSAFGPGSYAFAGPGTIHWEATNVVMTYTMELNTNVFTFITSATEPTTISIPAGKRMEMFNAIARGRMWLLEKDTKSAPVLFEWGRAYDGPFVLSLLKVNDPRQLFPLGVTDTFPVGAFTYAISDTPTRTDISARPSSLILERTTDLINWAEVFRASVSTTRDEFYRWRVVQP